MRIAILTGVFPSVSETFVLQHAADLLARGHEVEVFPERPPPGPVDHPELREGGLLARRFLPPPMPEAKLARLLDAARQTFARRGGARASLLRSLNPVAYGRRGASLSLLYRQLPLLGRRPYDAVHCHHGPVALEAVRLRRLGVLRGPLVVSFHGHDVNVAARAAGAGLYAPVFGEARRLLANSRFLCGRLRALGAPRERLARQPVGVRPGEFAPATPGAGDEGELRLLSVARLVPEKGIDVALRAVARLARRRPRLRYAIAGDGPERAALERLAAELGIAARVTFLGALGHEAVRARLADAHAFCLPSVVGNDGAEESQGLALVEAQAAGLPVVASALGGVPESLRPGATGFLVPPRDPEALAARLDALCASPALRASLGRAGRAFAARHFDRDALADRLLRLYAGLAPPRPSAPPLSSPAPVIALRPR